MKSLILLALVLVVGCSSPTAPSPPPPVVVVAPPVVVVPPPPPIITPPAPTRNPLLDDPRFDPVFYRYLALNGYESPGRLFPLHRQRDAPHIYLRTVHTNGRAIDAMTLDQTAAALINTVGVLTGAFGLAGLETGTGTRAGQPGWITVTWEDHPTARLCGEAGIGSDWLALYTNTPGCRCAGGPAIKPLIIKHELGHALGFWHTDQRSDLMHSGGHTSCDMQPSAREIFHARVAYTQPIGSLDPQ